MTVKVYISADIEGVGCVVRPEHSTIPGREYAQSRLFMTEEVNAAIRGAYDAGATHVLVSDSHNVGLNLLPEALDPRAELIMGNPRPLSMMEGINQGFDAVFFVGYHAKPGTENALLAHNFHGRVRDILINNVSLGELGMNAALAGIYHAPVVLITGDEVTTLEANALLPHAQTVSVKRGIGAYAAQCLHPHVCRERIYQASRQALANLPKAPLFTVTEPATMEVHVTTASSADRLTRVPGLNRISPMVLRAENLTMRQAYDVFLTLTDLIDMVPFI